MGFTWKCDESKAKQSKVVMGTGTDGRPTADQELVKTYFGLLLEPYMEEIKKRWAADVTPQALVCFQCY